MNNEHVYLSTACWHAQHASIGVEQDFHDYCNAMVGVQGVKRPATCKWCDAVCQCHCHHSPAREVSNRPTMPAKVRPRSGPKERLHLDG